MLDYQYTLNPFFPLLFVALPSDAWAILPTYNKNALWDGTTIFFA